MYLIYFYWSLSLSPSYYYSQRIYAAITYSTSPSPTLHTSNSLIQDFPDISSLCQSVFTEVEPIVHLLVFQSRFNQIAASSLHPLKCPSYCMSIFYRLFKFLMKFSTEHHIPQASPRIYNWSAFSYSYFILFGLQYSI